jgi:hypothetical protein
MTSAPSSRTASRAASSPSREIRSAPATRSPSWCESSQPSPRSAGCESRCSEQVSTSGRPTSNSVCTRCTWVTRQSSRPRRSASKDERSERCANPCRGSARPRRPAGHARTPRTGPRRSRLRVPPLRSHIRPRRGVALASMRSSSRAGSRATSCTRASSACRLLEGLPALGVSRISPMYLNMCVSPPSCLRWGAPSGEIRTEYGIALGLMPVRGPARRRAAASSARAVDRR